jgi:hypothetical protein
MDDCRARSVRLGGGALARLSRLEDDLQHLHDAPYARTGQHGQCE